MNSDTTKDNQQLKDKDVDDDGPSRNTKIRQPLPQPRETRINHRDLNLRLQKELERDERMDLINEAKLRAMNQGTASYEEFRQIWMAAHLRPMEKRDKLESGMKSKVVWNSVVGSGESAERDRKDDKEANNG